jgi:hypothetical protein
MGTVGQPHRDPEKQLLAPNRRYRKPLVPLPLDSMASPLAKFPLPSPSPSCRETRNWTSDLRSPISGLEPSPSPGQEKPGTGRVPSEYSQDRNQHSGSNPDWGPCWSPCSYSVLRYRYPVPTTQHRHRPQRWQMAATARETKEQRRKTTRGSSSSSSSPASSSWLLVLAGHARSSLLAPSSS